MKNGVLPSAGSKPLQTSPHSHGQVQL